MSSYLSGTINLAPKPHLTPTERRRYEELHDKAEAAFLDNAQFYPGDWLDGTEQDEFNKLDHKLEGACADARCWCVNG